MNAADGELGAMLPRVAAALSAAAAPATDESWCDLTAVDLLERYRGGEVEPGAVVDACFARIARIDGRVGAIWATDEAAAQAAAAVAAGRWRSGTARSLEGVPIVVKDLLDTAGMRTTGGSRVYADRIPSADATVVAAARAAGAIVIAKTATYELGCGNEQTPWGVVANPWDHRHTTGGSSAGSAAALAARMAPLAIGTDTGGSIRIPSSYCGVVGLKPTLGRMPTGGLLGLAPTLDTAGPMARTATDAALLFTALTPAVASATSMPLVGMRIGVVGGWFTDVLARDVRAAFEAAVQVLAGLGATIVPVEITDAVHGGPLSWLITMAEAATTYAGVPRDEMTDQFRARLEIGDRIDRATYLGALRSRQVLAASVTADIAGVDAVVVPACVSSAPRLDDMDAPVAGVPVTWPDVSARTMALWNVTGLPSVGVPIGFGPGGLPLGMQVAGRPFADERCLAVAAAYQAATTHHLVSPPATSIDWSPPGHDAALPVPTA